MNAVHTLPYCFFDSDLILFFSLRVGLPIYLQSSICYKKKDTEYFNIKIVKKLLTKTKLLSVGGRVHLSSFT